MFVLKVNVLAATFFVSFLSFFLHFFHNFGRRFCIMFSNFNCFRKSHPATSPATSHPAPLQKSLSDNPRYIVKNAVPNSKWSLKELRGMHRPPVQYNVLLTSWALEKFFTQGWAPQDRPMQQHIYQFCADNKLYGAISWMYANVDPFKNEIDMDLTFCRLGICRAGETNRKLEQLANYLEKAPGEKIILDIRDNEISPEDALAFYEALGPVADRIELKIEAELSRDQVELALKTQTKNHCGATPDPYWLANISIHDPSYLYLMGEGYAQKHSV